MGTRRSLLADDTTAQTRLFCRQNMTGGELHSLPHGRAAVFAARCPTRETDNEDAAALIVVDELRALLAVADGVGGHAAGAEAAKVALEAIRTAAAGAGHGENDLRAAVLDGFERANEQIAAMGVGAATTLAVVEMDGPTMRPYHVGDSMILVVGQRGKLRYLTMAHSPVGYAQEAGLIDEHEAIHHEDRHLVSNIVGMSDMRIDIGPTMTLKTRDTLLLGTDGLFDNLRQAEIVQAVRKGPMDEATARLAREARQRMTQPEEGHPSKPDDLTFILYRTDPPVRIAMPQSSQVLR
jgi:serine/threonine protein phosphatase PrpC